MKSILLIDNDPFLIDIYASQLKKTGYKIELASDGEIALSKIKELKPDLLVLDIILPKVDGWEFLKTIRQDTRLKQLKVVILSNLGQKEEVEKGFDFGAVRYFIKAEYTPKEVVEEIKKILK